MSHLGVLMNGQLNFAIGDKVVYPNHGVGVIEQISSRTIGHAHRVLSKALREAARNRVDRYTASLSPPHARIPADRCRGRRGDDLETPGPRQPGDHAKNLCPSFSQGRWQGRSCDQRRVVSAAQNLITPPARRGRTGCAVAIGWQCSPLFCDRRC